MRRRSTGWAALVVLLAAGISPAQDKTLPPPDSTAPAKPEKAPTATMKQGVPVCCGPSTCATAGTTPVVNAPQGPAPGAYYLDTPCSARRHPICLWLTYVPARRPYLTGSICQKAPNCQPPLYDYFPCCFDQCYTRTSCQPKAGLFSHNKCGPAGCTP